MSLTFSSIEAEYISQLINRINLSSTYQALTEFLFSQLKQLIDFKQGLSIRVLNTNNELSIVSPVFFKTTGLAEENNLYKIGFLQDFWRGYLEAPWSTIFRSSDLRDEKKWLQSPMYKKVFEPLDLYYSLYLSLVHNDIKLGVICLYNNKKSGDFSEKDITILELLKPHLELKMFRLLNRESGFIYERDPAAPQFSVSNSKVRALNLTNREAEISDMLLKGMKNEEICKKLCITASTLEKHIHNIYKKTGSRNRVTLFQNFKS